MKAVEFCYWLQGVFEVGKPISLDAEQTGLVKKHLNMVFVHEIDPSYPSEQQADLTAAHDGEPARRPGGWTGRDNVVLRC